MNLRSLLIALSLALAAFSAAADCPRIVSQSPYITQALLWMGLEKCIVGVSRYDALDRPHTGGVIDPDPEVIGLLEPKLMITSNWTDAAKWQAMRPAGADALRVDGFHGMDDAERMLREIGHAAKVADIDARVAAFSAEWHTAAGRVDSRGRRALIVTACGGAPYSFGRGTTLFDLFSRAGFTVVADHDSIRNFRAETAGEQLPKWINSVHPDIIFAIKNRRDEACNAALAQPKVTILPLDGELFTHPGPLLLKGLEQLREAAAL